MTAPCTLALLVPAYNAAAFLPRVLESARNQVAEFDEVWVYDDCSSDDTQRVAEGLGASVVRGEVNRGCTYGKSVLAERTACDWIHFHDADDVMLPNFVSTARKWMSQEDVDVVAFGCEERWEDTGDLIGTSVPDDAGLSKDPIGYTITEKINAISGLYRRRRFLEAGGFDLDPEVHYNEDQACHDRLARAGLRFRGDPTVTVVNFRQKSSMWTSNQAKCLRARYHVLCKTLAADVGHKQQIGEELWRVAAGAASQLDWKTADAAVVLATSLSDSAPSLSNPAFRAISRLSPRGAIRVRELLIRCLKPRLRSGYPGWRMPTVRL